MSEIWNPVENPKEWQRFCRAMGQDAQKLADRQTHIAKKWLELAKASEEAEKSKKGDQGP